MHMYFQVGGGLNTLCIQTGTTTISNLASGTNYSFDSDPTTGNPRIKNLNATAIKGYYNNLAIIWNELGRRIYPVVRDKNQLVLTDGTNTTTLTSTAGYPISKASDVTITSVADGNLLVYNFFQSKFFCTGLRLCLWPCRF